MSTTTTTTTTNGGGGGGGGGGKDLISELPDPILHCILSYLDMTTVFGTSFLSKRWRYLWTTLPFLNFNESVYASTFSRSEVIVFFVDRVLSLRNQNSNVQSFRFSYDFGNDGHIASHIYTWIQILVQSKVQVIDIQVNCSNSYAELKSFKLPISLFTCQSLTTLKLDFSGSEEIHSCTSFKLPSSLMMICLPALKTLHLISLSLPQYSVESLISRSPTLETLIINCCIIGKEEFDICNPQIKSLTIERMFWHDDDSCLLQSCEIKVFAPKMTFFSCTDYMGYINRYSFVNISSLVKAEIDIEKGYIDESDIDPSVNRKNAIDRLRGICNVQSLMLSRLLLELVTEVPESLDINPFCNLSFLTLKITFSKYQISAIPYLLEKCPNLEYLVLKPTKWERDEGWEAELAPQCMMHHLRLVEIWDVRASVNELEFLKFLLKNAIVLEKMIIFASKEESDDYTKRLRGFSEKLKSFRGASTSSEILFV